MVPEEVERIALAANELTPFASPRSYETLWNRTEGFFQVDVH